MRVGHDFFLVPGSRSTFPEADPDSAQWYGSGSVSGSETLIFFSNVLHKTSHRNICPLPIINCPSCIIFANFHHLSCYFQSLCWEEFSRVAPSRPQTQHQHHHSHRRSTLQGDPKLNHKRSSSIEKRRKKDLGAYNFYLKYIWCHMLVMSEVKNNFADGL